MTAFALLSPRAKLYSLVPLSSACPSTVTVISLFFLIQAACLRKVSLDAVVNIDLFVAKKTLSLTPVAKNSTVSAPVKISDCIRPLALSFAAFFCVAHAVSSRLAKTTNKIFLKLLKFSHKFWKIKKITKIEKNIFIKHCLLFYKNKTFKRISLFYKKFYIKDKKEIINGHTIPKLSELLNQVDWQNISNGIPVRFHGDFHFENILFQKEKNKFILLDWRENFSKYLNLGDIYYDFAKLMHGLIVNHGIIANDQYSALWKDGEIKYDLHRKQSLVECEHKFNNWIVSSGYDLKKVRILTALIYLNIAALHHYPYSLLLYGLGKKMLYKESSKEL